MKKSVGQMSAKGELRVLVVEDRHDDALLLLHELEQGGYNVSHTRVETVDALKRALVGGEWHLVVSDFSLPSMTAHDVLRTVTRMKPELPCIVVSGTISEEAAVDVLRAGARDFVVKERMARLIPAIGRELQESAERRRRHEAEAILKETRERMQFALEAVGIGTWEVDFRTGRAIWSDALERLHGLAPGTFGGTIDALASTIHQEDRDDVMRRIRQDKPDLQDYRVEYRTTWPDGSLHWIASIGRTVVGDREAGTLKAVGVGMDITAQKRLEEQFRQAQKMESIGSLAGGIAHDFNNLLTVIGGCCELVALKVSGDVTVAEPLEEIRSATQSATALTRQLLTFSRQQIVMPLPLDLTATVNGFSKILRRLVEENVQIEFRLSPDLGTVRADPGQVEQVLLNLVANARDAMPNGGTVTIETRRAAPTNDDVLLHPELGSGNFVELSVADTGSGMSPEVRARLFEPFFTTKPVGRGTGLGLATVYGIVTQTGGYIVVDSAPGVGTTFRIYLPVDTRAAEPARPEREGARPVTGHETILVVEDNAPLRRLNERILQRYGYTVLTAANGVEAQHVCTGHAGPIHIVLVDVIMPGDSGPTVAAWITERRPETRIIYTSGYVGEAIEDARILGSEGMFLQKPFTPAQLASAIRDVLSRPDS
jgi:two-component system, cell cycle sensor histidine kinase and response regulator CckA